MKYAVGMGSVAMIYIPSFVKIGSGIQKLIRGESQTQRGDCIGLTFIFQNEESRLKTRRHTLGNPTTQDISL
jgi:hypothetical protein